MQPCIKSMMAICEVFPAGQKVSSVALEYEKDLSAASYPPDTFTVQGYTVTGVTRDQEEKARLLITLDVSGKETDLTYFEGEGPEAVWHRKAPDLLLRQAKDIETADGEKLPAWEKAEAVTKERELLVEQFTQHVFHSKRTGRDLPYNLFLPEGYDGKKEYPLLLFIHDRGPLSEDPKTTLRQGIGAVCWVTEAFQREHPSIILAPQFAKVPDRDGDPDMLETTYDLYEEIKKTYAVDPKRRYATGQSMGCMSIINMSIRRPGLFTAMLLVAGQWDAEAMKVLHDKEMLIIVSRGDPRAFAGMNEALVKLEDEGAVVEFKAVSQDGGVVPEEEMQELLSRPANIHYAVLKTRVRDFSCHMGTWQVAYGIKSAKEWLFSKQD